MVAQVGYSVVSHTGPFGTVTHNNLCMHRLTNQPSYFIISNRKARTGPMTETSDANVDGGPHQASGLRMKVETSIEPKV
jgi:hypothetical protein